LRTTRDEDGGNRRERRALQLGLVALGTPNGEAAGAAALSAFTTKRGAVTLDARTWPSDTTPPGRRLNRFRAPTEVWTGRSR
jgi:hypothetical protein